MGLLLYIRRRLLESSDTLKPWNDSVNQPLWAFALHKEKNELFYLYCTRINTTLLYYTRINTIQPHHRLWQRLGSYGFRLSITASTIIVIVAEIGHEWNQLHPHIVYCYHIKVKQDQGPVIEASLRKKTRPVANATKRCLSWSGRNKRWST